MPRSIGSLLSRHGPWTMLGLLLALASAGMLGLEPRHACAALEERLPGETEPAESDPSPVEEGKLVFVRQGTRETRHRPRGSIRAGASEAVAPPATQRSPPLSLVSRSPYSRRSPVSAPLLC